MHEAAKDAEETIGVLSSNSLASKFVQQEWAAALVVDPTGEKRKLLLMRVQDCRPDGLLAAIGYLDLVDLDEDAAREKVLAGAGGKRLKPSTPPNFPDKLSAPKEPRFPGALPPIWNVPQMRNPNFTGREQILNDLHAALNSGAPESWLQALTGLGGKGKTTLAREFAYRHQADYDLVWWVHADESASITMDYDRLAALLGLPKMDSPDQTVNAVKRWLGQNRKWLLIFDNARDPDAVNRFLPQGGGGHVLITSRNPNWGSAASLQPVEVFEPAEAVEFLFRRTNQNDHTSAEALATETGRLPLALEQAAAYIKESGITLSGYLARFRKYQAEMLKRGKPADYSNTVATTWNISFQEVMAKSQAGANLLVLCSFLAPDDIPRSLIAGGTEHYPEPLASVAADEIEIDRAIAELRRYSLITGDGDSFSMHQLVQTVLRSELAEEEQKKWSTASLNLLNGVFQFDENDQESWAVCAQLLPHALACAGYAEKIGAAPESIAEILNNSGSYQRHFADFYEAKSCFERALKIDEKAFGLEHPSVARDVNNLGSVLQDLGDLQGAKRCIERALSIDEKALGPDHTSVAAMANNLGSVLQALGDLQGAKSCFERALKIDEKALGPEHTSVARDVNNLGGVLQALGDLKGAKKCIERALSIDEKALEPEHTSVAIRVNNLGSVLKALGDLKGAKSCYERAFRISKKFLGDNHPSTLKVKANLDALDSQNS
jgi:tetratricopeptide (TPR) repeat protein